MYDVELVLLIGGTGLAWLLWWLTHDEPPSDDDDPGDPEDYGADRP